MIKNIYLDKKICSLFYIVMNISLKIIYYLTIIFFIYFLWNQRHMYIGLFDPETLLKSHQTKTWEEYKDFMLFIAWATFYFVLKILIIILLIKGFGKIWIPTRWINQWEAENTIDNLFGRYLCYHIRLHHHINLKDFYHLNKFCNKQKKLLLNIDNNKDLVGIFNKYDKNYNSDIKD